MRFQHGVDDRPTRSPISATESEASSCRTVRILRSMASRRRGVSSTAGARSASDIENFFYYEGVCPYHIEEHSNRKSGIRNIRQAKCGVADLVKNPSTSMR